MSGQEAILGILTISDRASRGEYQDESGPAILAFFEEGSNFSMEISHGSGE